MDNMRSYPAKKQTLRLADGGSAMFRWANRLVGNNEQAQQQRGRTVEQVVPEAPIAPAPAPVNPDNPAGIRFADGGLRGGADRYTSGSRDGGRVVGPGTGVSDSVPARYSNGEYVLPADTAAAIGHDKLDAVKDATHTPAAVQRGYSLRGNPLGDQHAGNYTDRRALAETVSGRFLAKPALVEPDAATENLPAVRHGLRPDSNGLPPVQSRPLTLRLSDGSPSGMGGPESPWAHAERVNPTGPASNFQSTGSADHFAPESAKPAGPSMKNPMNWGEGVRDATRATAQTVGKAAGVASGAVASGTKAVAKGVAGHGLALGNIVGATAAHGNAYFDGQVPFMDKLRIGATDATALAGGAVGGIVGGTLGAMTGPAAVVAAPAGAIVGSGIGDVGGRWLGNKVFGGSDAQTRNGYDPVRSIIDVAKDSLRNGVSDDVFGRPMRPAGAGRGSVNPPLATSPQPAATGPGATSAAPANPAATLSPGDATMPGQDPGRPAPPPTLRGQAGTDVYGAPGVSKFTQAGKTLYSNVSGADNDKLMSNRPGVSTVPGMSRAEIDATLGGKSAGQTSADNAIRAANLRDGVDMERGISSSGSDLQKLAMSPLGTPGRSFAQKQLIEQQQHAVTLRGQDLSYDANTFGHKLNAEVSRNRLRYDMGKDQRDYSTGRDDKGFEQGQAADKAWNDHTAGIFRTRDDKGNDVADTQKAAAYTTAVDNTIGLLIPQFAKSPDPKIRAHAADLAKRGRAALDPEDRGNLQVMFERQQLHAATAGGINPFTSSGAVSQNLLDYKATGPDNGVFQDRTSMGDPKAGRSIPNVNLRYGAGANHLWPNTGAGSTYLAPNKLRGE